MKALNRIERVVLNVSIITNVESKISRDQKFVENSIVPFFLVYPLSIYLFPAPFDLRQNLLNIIHSKYNFNKHIKIEKTWGSGNILCIARQT